MDPFDGNRIGGNNYAGYGYGEADQTPELSAHIADQVAFCIEQGVRDPEAIADWIRQGVTAAQVAQHIATQNRLLLSQSAQAGSSSYPANNAGYEHDPYRYNPAGPSHLGSSYDHAQSHYQDSSSVAGPSYAPPQNYPPSYSAVPLSHPQNNYGDFDPQGWLAAGSTMHEQQSEAMSFGYPSQRQEQFASPGQQSAWTPAGASQSAVAGPSRTRGWQPPLPSGPHHPGAAPPDPASSSTENQLLGPSDQAASPGGTTYSASPGMLLKDGTYGGLSGDKKRMLLPGFDSEGFEVKSGKLQDGSKTEAGLRKFFENIKKQGKAGKEMGYTESTLSDLKKRNFPDLINSVRSEAARIAQAAMGEEGRSKASRKGKVTMGEARLKEAIRKGRVTMGEAGRSAAIRKGNATRHARRLEQNQNVHQVSEALMAQTQLIVSWSQEGYTDHDIAEHLTKRGIDATAQDVQAVRNAYYRNTTRASRSS